MANPVLFYGSIYALLFFAFLAVIVVRNPRMMLHDYPKEIQDIVPSKTEKEKKETETFFVPIRAVLLAYPFIVTFVLAILNKWDFEKDFVFAWALMQFLNLFDLLIIDWLIFCLINPAIVVLTGTKDHKAYKDYFFHFVEFIKGFFILSLVALAMAGTISIVLSLFVSLFA